MRNSGKRWSGNDERTLVDLVERRLPLNEICLKLGRSPSAVRSKAQELGLSLKPTNHGSW